MKLFRLGMLVGVCFSAQVFAEPIHSITIDGNFTDWANVPTYTDPVNDEHDTDHDLVDDEPFYVDHDDVDIIEFKFTHDDDNLYGYFKSSGEIGETVYDPLEDKGGRFYIIVTINVDDDDATGYPLHEGGYFPTSTGYDLNFEVEYYDGAYNTGHYLQHGVEGLTLTPGELAELPPDPTDEEISAKKFEKAQGQQSLGLIDILPGNYDNYTQWVWWDYDPSVSGQIAINEDYLDGTHIDAWIRWVLDKGAAYPGVIVEVARSVDNSEIEIKAPFRGFMKHLATEENIMKLGQVIDASFSLEASGELAVGQEWASDTAEPIIGYYLSALTYAEDLDQDDLGDAWETFHGVSDPDADEDGDGITNFNEFLKGLNPNSDDVWVDFSAGSTGNGAEDDPWDTFGEGYLDVAVNGTLHIASGTTVETRVIGKAMTLLAEGGIVRLGE